MSTCVEEIHLNDVGTIFRMTLLDCTTPINLINVSVKQLLFKKPSGVVLVKTAFFYTDGFDGIIQHTTVSGDLSELGEWKWQAYVVNPSGAWRSNVEKFRVFKNV